MSTPTGRSPWCAPRSGTWLDRHCRVSLMLSMRMGHRGSILISSTHHGLLLMNRPRPMVAHQLISLSRPPGGSAGPRKQRQMARKSKPFKHGPTYPPSMGRLPTGWKNERDAPMLHKEMTTLSHTGRLLSTATDWIAWDSIPAAFMDSVTVIVISMKWPNWPSLT